MLAKQGLTAKKKRLLFPSLQKQKATSSVGL